MEDLSKSITEKEISENEFVGYADIIREIVIAKLKRRDRLRSVKVVENVELDNFKFILGDIYRLNCQNPWLSYIVYLCRIKERQIKSPINVTAKVIGRTRSVVDNAIAKLYNTVSCHACLVDPVAIDDNVKITPDTKVSVFLQRKMPERINRAIWNGIVRFNNSFELYKKSREKF